MDSRTGAPRRRPSPSDDRAADDDRPAGDNARDWTPKEPEDDDTQEWEPNRPKDDPREWKPGDDAREWTRKKPASEEPEWTPKRRSGEAPGGPSEREPAGRLRLARPRRRGVIVAVAVAVLAAAIYGVCSLAPVRTVLRQSFTQISSPALQFYFNGNPWVSGELLNIPLGIELHGSSGLKTYDVRVWMVDGGGKTDFSSTVALPVRNGTGAENFSLLIRAGGQVVWAQVAGTSLSLHYRFAGSAIASPSSTR